MILLLPDADVVIDLHSLNLWDRITRIHKVYIPSIILHKEVYRYPDSRGDYHTIQLENQIGKTITEISCEADDLLEFSQRFDFTFQTEIHEGEKEALILLKKKDQLRFCTCDKSAIIALALLDLVDRGISFEKLLKISGISTRQLEYKHTEKYFRHWAREGSIMKIQGRGISSNKSKKTRTR